MSRQGRELPPRYAYGFHPVREALRSKPHQVSRLLVAGSSGKKRREELAQLARRHGIPLEDVGVAELNRLVKGVHNGVVAEIVAVTESGSSPEPPTGLIVLLEDIQDPRNLGAILRVCEGVGVERVLIRDRGSAPLTPVVEKASAGAIEWLDVERVPNSGRAIQELQSGGYWVYGADADGVPVWDVDLDGQVAICLGGEEKGLRRRTKSLCDGLVGLPMRGRVQSLNVAAAAAAILYEVVRQRQAESDSETP